MPFALAKPQMPECPHGEGLVVCTLQAGDVVYVPDGWQHATQDMSETVGVSVLYEPAV